MKVFRPSSVVVLAALSLTGCATTLDITYNSDPQGATLYDANGALWGNTPVTLSYDAAKKFGEGQCVNILPTKVR